MTAWLTDNLRSPVAIFYGLVLFIALPAGVGLMLVAPLLTSVIDDMGVGD